MATSRLRRIAASLTALAIAACGGGSGGGGSGTGQAPALRTSPQSATILVGQGAVFRAEAGGAGVFEWQQRYGAGAWGPASGDASTSGETSELRVLGGSTSQSDTWYRALARNAAGEVASGEARLNVVWGTVSTLEPNDIDHGGTGEGPGGGDGGSPGGGDGDGVGAGGGLGKTPQVRVTVSRTSDGVALGSALTGKTSGLVRIKAGPGTAPVLLTLTGTPLGSYYDEGRGAMLPYGPDEPPLHALVTAFDQNLGITALTEAAYRYAVNHFVADPDSIRDGLAPLRRSASAAEIAQLTPAQIKQAQEVVRTQINKLLPPRYQLQSLETLPTPVDDQSGRGTLVNNRYGIMQAVTGGLALAANRFDGLLDRPALDVARQIADDLTDGTIDGVALDKGSVFAGVRASYDPANLAKNLTDAADALFDVFGGVPPLPSIVLQPGSVTIDAGNSTTLSVQASGTSMTYQWFVGGTAIPGAVSRSLAVTAAGDYNVVISNPSGSVTSAIATVTVLARVTAPPIITRQPLSLVLSLGGSATFSVGATGADLAYQWFDGGRVLPGENSASLVTDAPGTYHVVVSNGAGSVRSADALLTISLVLDRPPR